MATGVGLLTFKKEQQLVLEVLEGATKGAGFKLLGTELEITGELVRTTGPHSEEAIGLRVTNRGQTYTLSPGDSELTRRNYTEVAQLLQEGSTRLRVRGRAHGHAGAAPDLVITKFEIIRHPE
jgi:hypothetical protein